MDDLHMAEQRQNMVQQQLVKRGIQDSRVLEVMGEIPRHLFVPDDLQNRAYEDCPLPIGEGQTISQPYIVALMTELLEIKPGDRILEVGSGSGYQAAVIHALGGILYTVECQEALAFETQDRLKKLGYGEVKLKTGDGSMGWPEEAPFNGIVVTAGSPQIPPLLVDQLVEEGRIVIPIGDRYSQLLTRGIKKDGKLQTEEYCGCVFVPLVGEYGWGE